MHGGSRGTSAGDEPDTAGADGAQPLVKALMESRRGATALLDAEGRVHYANRAWRKLVGDACDMVTDALTPQESDRIRWLLDEAAEYGRCAATLAFRTPGGNRLRFPVHLERVHVDDGTRFLLYADPRTEMSDLDEDRGWSGERVTTALIEAARASSRARTRRELCQRATEAFFHVYPAPIVVILLKEERPDALTLVAADGASRAWLDRSWHLPLVAESPSPLVQAVLKRRTVVIDRVEMVRRFEEFEPFPEGEVMPEEVAATFARLGIRTIADTPIVVDGEPVGVIGMASERERVDEGAVRLLELLAHEIGEGLRRLDLEAAREELLRATRASQEDLADYTYNLSHDVSEELRRTQTLTRLLMSDYAEDLPPDGRELAERITRTVTGLQERVKASLHMANALRRHGPAKKRPVDLARVVDAAVDRARNTEEGRRIRFTTTGEPPTVQADPDAVAIVLDQLLSNAIRFADPHAPYVRVHATSVPEGGGELWIEDNGPGVPEPYRESIFRPFRKVPTHEETPSHGVGLALVAELVKSHQGRVWVTDREDGPGASFRVRLPGAP